MDGVHAPTVGAPAPLAVRRQEAHFSIFFNNLQRVLRKAVPNCNIVFAYGAAKFAPGGRGELSVPTSRANKECVTRVSTKVTAEFRSSKVDYKDDSLLQQIAVKGSNDFALRGLLWNAGEKEFISPSVSQIEVGGE